MLLLTSSAVQQGIIGGSGDPWTSLYDPVYSAPTPSESEAAAQGLDQMPIGNGDTGLGVWAEDSGAVVLSIGKGDAFDENHKLLKVGRVRLTFAPNPFARSSGFFQQRLHLHNGSITIATPVLSVLVWIDAHSNIAKVLATSVRATGHFNVTAAVEVWRDRAAPVPGVAESGDLGPCNKNRSRSADTVRATSDDVTWYHRNPLLGEPNSLDPANSSRTSLWETELDLQGLLGPKLPSGRFSAPACARQHGHPNGPARRAVPSEDPLTNLTFGASFSLSVAGSASRAVA
eukprot:SAG31_NODE_12170_length_962_cov_0.887601_1_plen_287_part_10